MNRRDKIEQIVQEFNQGESAPMQITWQDRQDSPRICAELEYGQDHFELILSPKEPPEAEDFWDCTIRLLISIDLTKRDLIANWNEIVSKCGERSSSAVGYKSAKGIIHLSQRRSSRTLSCGVLKGVMDTLAEDGRKVSEFLRQHFQQ